MLAHALHEALAMHNTTPVSAPVLESIHAAALLFVSGGCHKHGCCSPQVVAMPPAAPAPAAAAAVATASAPAPAPAPDPAVSAQPTGDVVTTNVSINGQPVQ
ncbi:MAG TPA: hypothetical protein VHT91_04630 [Kofleriaceae bacterium]|nr:hypothetical protein [Kofleriaceae bacterium]